MQLLLLSNSRDSEGRYLHHARGAISEHLDGIRRDVIFLPYAGMPASWDTYEYKVQGAFAPLGISVHSVHKSTDQATSIRNASAILVGGGNTFHLLSRLQQLDLLEPIRERAIIGVPYVGWSAGSVLSCPTIQTTNDMPIVQPMSFTALNLVRFQINAHFTDAHPPGFQGETRRERIAEFLEVNREALVIGLPEGDWLQSINGTTTLRGDHPAPFFRWNVETVLLDPGAEVPASD